MRDLYYPVILTVVVVGGITLFSIFTLSQRRQQVEASYDRLLEANDKYIAQIEEREELLLSDEYTVLLDGREASEGEINIIAARQDEYSFDINDETHVITVLSRTKPRTVVQYRYWR